jgi:hypothetical protein
MISIIGFKSDRMMIFMAVKDKEPVGALRSRCCILIKVFNPLYTNLIINPAIISYYKTSVRENLIESNLLKISSG